MGFCKLNDEDAGPKKTPEYSLIELGNQVYTFFAGDDSRTNQVHIHRFLKLLRLEAEASGYVPNTNCVLHDVDEPMKVKLIIKGAMMLMLMRLFVCFFICIVWGVGLSMLMLMLMLMFKYN